MANTNHFGVIANKFRWIILLMYLCFLNSVVAQKSEEVNCNSMAFVKNGKAMLLDNYFLYGHMSQQSEHLAIYSGTREEFPQYNQHYLTIGVLAGKAIHDGDFHISIRLRPQMLNRNKDSVKIGTYYYDFELMFSIKIGTHYYDFELTENTLTYLGRMLDAVTFQRAVEIHPLSLPEGDRPFAIDIIRTDKIITIKANGQALYFCSTEPFLPGDIAINVGCNFPNKPKSVLRVYDFGANGYLTDRSVEEEKWRQRVVPRLRQMRRNGNAFGYVEDHPGLPRILIIGDSISFDYMDTASAMLKGKANVHRIPDNAKTTTFGLENLERWLNNEKWDIIHFNFGLWDLTQTSPEDYRENLEKIVQILQTTNARLVWANTTPVPKETTVIPTDADIKYNAIASKIMQKYNIPINDLHSYVLPYIDEYKLSSANIHFNMKGSATLGKKVGKTLADFLNNQTKTD